MNTIELLDYIRHQLIAIQISSSIIRQTMLVDELVNLLQDEELIGDD